MMKRETIAIADILMATAAAWPITARAQQTDRVRRVAILMGYAEGDAEAKALLLEFTQALSDFGWIEGRNLRIDIRWAPGRIDLMRTCAKELVSLQPDVILADSTPVTAALKHETSSIPIVFAAVADPVGSEFVKSLPRPGGNITGFSSLETSMASKWLELLTEIAPGTKRTVMMFNPDTAPYAPQMNKLAIANNGYQCKPLFFRELIVDPGQRAELRATAAIVVGIAGNRRHCCG
jgi:putative ABC transport system substrate-binding protein